MISQMDRRFVFGINLVFRDDPSFDSAMVAKMVAAHCQSASFGINWDWIQPNSSSDWVWSPFDERLALLHDNGIEPVAGIVGIPFWARHIEASGTATSGGYDYLDNTNADFSPYKDGRYDVEITGGTGQSQKRQIKSTVEEPPGTPSTRLYVKPAWGTPPDSTSSYRIAGHAAFVMPEDTQANWDAFHNFCREVAIRYTGKIRYYGFWNEPDNGQMFFDVKTSIPNGWDAVGQGYAMGIHRCSSAWVDWNTPIPPTWATSTSTSRT